MADAARGHGAHSPQARRALSGARAESQGLRGGGRRRRRRDRRVRRGVRIVLAARTSTARSRRASTRFAPVVRGRARAAAFACAATSRACSAVRTKARSRRKRWPTSRKALFDMGCYEVSLGDTIGVGTPARTQRDARSGRAHVPVDAARRPLSRHVRPGARQHLRVAGVRRRASSTARSPGSAAARTRRARPATSRPRTSSTCCTASASQTGIDLDRLIDAGEYICSALGRPTNSRVGRALLAKRGKSVRSTSRERAA